MAIVKYLGPFGLNGQPTHKTKVWCKCDECPLEWETSVGKTKSSRSAGSLCLLCSRNGRKTYRPDQLIAINNQVAEVLGPLNKDGFVVDRTKVIYLCGRCNRWRKTRYSEIRKNWESLRCRACSRDENQDRPILFASDILSLYKAVTEIITSSGHYGDVLSSDKVAATCYGCKKSKAVSLRNIVRQGTERWRCARCADADRSSAMIERWRDKAYVAAVQAGHNNAPTLTGWLTKPHQAVKQLMQEHGINGFESEQWIGRKRVDELNCKLRLVILVQGRFWHADPRYYDANDKMYEGMIAEQIWQRDKDYIGDLQNLGYEVFEVWEDDIHNDPQGVISEIARWMTTN